MSVLIACICQFAERFAVAHRGGKLRAEADSVNSMRTDEPNQFLAASSVRLRENLLEHASSFVLHRRARFIFLVKKIFPPRLKIKFIFFLSISQLISSLKPAGEGSHNAYVNKL
jgi:hypothetical protein